MLRMKTEIEVTFENDHVKIITSGEHSIDTARKVWSKAVETCVAQNCYKILGISNSTIPVSTIDGYDHADLFRELGINHKYRIAWVEQNSNMVEEYRFVETVLQNRGLPGKLFKDIKEARNWLFNDS